jgi:hypothetical protein
MSEGVVGSNGEYLRKFQSDFKLYQKTYLDIHPNQLSKPDEVDLSTILDVSVGNSDWPLYSCELIGKYLRGLKPMNTVRSILNQCRITIVRSSKNKFRVQFLYLGHLLRNEILIIIPLPQDLFVYSHSI